MGTSHEFRRWLPLQRLQAAVLVPVQFRCCDPPYALAPRVAIRHDDGGAGEHRKVLRLWRTTSESDPQNHEMLQHINPICDLESGGENNQEDQLRRCNTE